MNEPPEAQRFLAESFPLVATYLHSETVTLGHWQVGGSSYEDEHAEFAKMVSIRHAVACAQRLLPILQSIEARPSTKTLLKRIDSRGAIKGRLDTSKYLARRASTISWPRTYPVIVNQESLATPENLLAYSASARLCNLLSSAHLPARTAERRDCDHFARLIYAKLRSAPWRELNETGNIYRLLVETLNRIRRQQTGNQNAYLRLCRWVQEWRAFPDTREEWQDQAIDGLVAFPEDGFFFERIFEIWTMQQVAKALDAIGGQRVDGPKSLYLRRDQPIYRYLYDGLSIEVWFQRSLQSKQAAWKYCHSDNALRGIPDVTLMSAGRASMIIDAKYRLAISHTRAEEAYKMLGYLENFRSELQSPRYHGCLVFLSHDGLFTVLEENSGLGRLTLLGAHPTDSKLCSLPQKLQGTIAEWLSSS